MGHVDRLHLKNLVLSVVWRFLLSLSVVLALIAAGIWVAGRIPATTRVGINYIVIQKDISLREKAVHFLSRHLAMRRLARDITGNKRTAVEKALAIQSWVVDNIMTPKRAGELPIIDDHPYSIVIRGYGTREQRSDLLTILCGYAGIPAELYRLTHPRTGRSIYLALLRLKDKSYLFDPGYDNVFYAKAGRLASLDELLEDLAPVKKAKNQPVIHGVPYVDYFSGIRRVSRFRRFTRADLQMPLPRIFYETLRMAGFKRVSLRYD